MQTQASDSPNTQHLKVHHSVSFSLVAMNPAQAVERSASRLYRDCLRLVDHIASKSPKGQQLRLILRTEFKKNVGETDPAKIEQLKGNAIRGLSNYLVHESGSNDPQLKKRMDAVKTHALSDLRQHGEGGTAR